MNVKTNITSIGLGKLLTVSPATSYRMLQKNKHKQQVDDLKNLVNRLYSNTETCSKIENKLMKGLEGTI